MASVDSHAHPVCSASSENRRTGPESNRVLPTGVEARPGPCGGPLRATIPEGECIRRIVLKSPVLEYCPPGSVRGARGNPRPYLDKLFTLTTSKQNPTGHEKPVQESMKNNRRNKWLTLLASICLPLIAANAQQPPSTDRVLWLKADAGTTLGTNFTVQKWADVR